MKKLILIVLMAFTVGLFSFCGAAEEVAKAGVEGAKAKAGEKVSGKKDKKKKKKKKKSKKKKK